MIINEGVIEIMLKGLKGEEKIRALDNLINGFDEDIQILSDKMREVQELRNSLTDVLLDESINFGIKQKMKENCDKTIEENTKINFDDHVGEMKILISKITGIPVNEIDVTKIDKTSGDITFVL